LIRSGADNNFDELYRKHFFVFFFSSRRRHTRSTRDWSSDVCSSDLRRRRPAFDRTERRGVAQAGSAGSQQRAQGELIRVLRMGKIGRASCRERVKSSGSGGTLKEK